MLGIPELRIGQWWIWQAHTIDDVGQFSKYYLPFRGSIHVDYSESVHINYFKFR